MSEAFSFEVSSESIEELKKAINYDELNTRSERFDNGTETEDDIINHCRNYEIEFENGNQLFVVEKKYFDKVIDLYQKEKEKNKKQAEHINNINKRNENQRMQLKLLQAHRLKKYMMDNYISKDKIRDKIKELDIEIQQCQYTDDDIEEYKNDMKKEKSRLLRDKKILQELLEEKNGK